MQVRLVLVYQRLDGDGVHRVLPGFDPGVRVVPGRPWHIRADHGSTTDGPLIMTGAMDHSQLLHDAGVSRREAEVLALLGRHLTNAEIAGRLFISVRTVESHVSALLRKLDLTDRRELAEVAAALQDSCGEVAQPVASPSLPSPLTSFVGREAERAALAQTLTEHRFVTAVGPGGVGKTRLALAVAADVAGRYADGACYVDLVPVTDAVLVGAAVANAFGFGEQPGRSPADTVISKLVAAEVLVVLDNCEHVVNGATTFVERLLSACPRATVLATSRVRLLVPFECVFPVSSLSLDDDTRQGDATALFIERAAMAGWRAPSADDRRRIGAVCRGLDGIALAIELAAARLVTFGLDGLEAGLADQLSLLSGGPRIDDRHRSVRSALDWSYGLLDETEQVVLRRASVFAAPFTSEAAATVTVLEPVMPEEVAGALGRLAEHNLLIVIAGSSGTRYRMLEAIRQYGVERMRVVGEHTNVQRRHLTWCLATATRLEAYGDNNLSFDEVADDLRAGLSWAVDQAPRHADDAHALAVHLARLTYAHGMPSEAQRRYEEAARLAADPALAERALHRGAAVAWGRAAGNDALRLYRAAAEAARRAADPRRAAVALATAAELINRAPGLMSELTKPGEQQVLLGEARALAGGDAHVEAAVLTVIALGMGDELDPASGELAERAVELARRVGDARLESAALDQLTSVRIALGEMDAATETVRRRLQLVTPLAGDVEMAWEHSDALHMAPLAYLGAGELRTARWFAKQRRELPFFREADHMAVCWLLTTAALAGDFDEAVKLAHQFRRGWIEAGRPTIGGLGFAPAAAAMVHGIRGDQEARHEWLGILAKMRRVVAGLVGDSTGYTQVFDGLVALHQGDIGTALSTLVRPPDAFTHWYDGAWRQWYAAVWAEAAVLAELSEGHRRLEQARFITAHNPVASAIVDRAEALASGDADKLLASAAALDAAGCPYQRARTLVFAGGDARVAGEAIFAAIGAAPMVT
jgi:predicted ATPase/DNA-binding CsgD family transcriptional regulator